MIYLNNLENPFSKNYNMSQNFSEQNSTSFSEKYDDCEKSFDYNFIDSFSNVYDSNVENEDEKCFIFNTRNNHQESNPFNCKDINILSNNLDLTISPKSILIGVDDIGFPFNFQKIPDLANIIINEELYISKIAEDKSKFIGNKLYRDNETIEEIKNKNKRKMDEDNIIKKIKISYLNFLPDFLNFLIKEESRINSLKFGYKFYKLEYTYKNELRKESKISFLQQTIENVLSSNISPKYTSKAQNSNNETCRKIREEEKLSDISTILSKNILFLFDKIYFSERKKKYNLKELGLSDMEFVLPKKIQLYEDLLSKNRNEEKFNTYKTKMNLCCKIYFMPGKQMPNFRTRKSK